MTAPMYNPVPSPCKGCCERTVGCHGSCERYAAYDIVMQQRRHEHMLEVQSFSRSIVDSFNTQAVRSKRKQCTRHG